MNPYFSQRSSLDTLCQELGIDSETRTQARQLLEAIAERPQLWPHDAPSHAVHAALLGANKSITPLNKVMWVDLPVSAVLCREPDVYRFLLFLGDCSKAQIFSDRGKHFVVNLVTAYNFSARLYGKARELWTAMGREFESLHEAAWYLFCLTRIHILMRRSELVESSYALIAVLELTLASCGIPKQNLPDVSEVASRFGIPAKKDKVVFYKRKVAELLDAYLEMNILRGHRQDLFVAALTFNTESLKEEYQCNISFDEFDERAFIPGGLHLKSFNLLQRLCDRRQYSELIYYDPQSTPFTLRDFVNSWLTIPPRIVQTVESLMEYQDLQEVLNVISPRLHTKLSLIEVGDPGDISKFLGNLIELDETEKNMSYARPDLLTLAETMMKNLFLILHETRKALPSGLDWSTVCRTLLACSLDIMLYCYDNSSLPFEELLGICEVSPFSAWLVLDHFDKSNPSLPEEIKACLILLETRLVSAILWNTSISAEFLRQFQYNSIEYRDLSCRILSHCRSIMPREESPSILQKVEEVLEYILTSKRHLLEDRHLDQIAISAFYGVCKAAGSPTKLNWLCRSKSRIQSGLIPIYRNVRVDSCRTADITVFYNGVFLKEIFLKLKSPKDIGKKSVDCSPTNLEITPSTDVRESPAVISSFSPLQPERVVRPFPISPAEHQGSDDAIAPTSEESASDK